MIFTDSLGSKAIKMKQLFLLLYTALVFSSCGPESTTSPASEYNEDSLHQRDRTEVDRSDTHAAPRPAPMSAHSDMAGLMHQNMQAMMAQASRGDADQDFATLMRIHHQGALEMAQMELAQGTDAQLKSMAQNISNNQRGEIATFEGYLAGHTAAGGSSPFYQKAQQAMKAMQHTPGAGSTIDQQFAQYMIPHHQHGVTMAQEYLPYAKDEQLKGMAESIIKQQQAEIATLQQWVKKQR
jgi:uncharacterized protein (DUF305 family)